MIFALSTPPGVSAIAVIRTSGEGCIEVVSGCLDKKPIEKNLALLLILWPRVWLLTGSLLLLFSLLILSRGKIC